MFTGIIEDLAAVGALERTKRGARLEVRTALATTRMMLGDSIAVNGACLTVVGRGRGRLKMEVTAETLRCTTLGELAPGDRVNLERCLTLSKPLGGHLVAGHVDGVGRVVAIEPEGDSRLFTFEVPASEARYLVEKGSVAIDGVSLTVFGVRGRRFRCALIPHTLRVTTLGFKQPGASVNVESDLIGKYVDQMLNGRGTARARRGSFRGGRS